MTSPFFLILVLVTITTASQPTQNSAANLNENAECATHFSRCEHELHEFRKQRERAKETANKLGNRLWRLAGFKQVLENEIRVLRHQVEHPDEPVPQVRQKDSGPGMVSYPKIVDLVTSNCTANLVRCNDRKIEERNIIQGFENTSEYQRTAIAEQLSVQNELRATAASLKSQLAARNVTPHPDSQKDDFNYGANLSSAESDIDSTEVERRVNATVDRRDTRSK